MDPRKPVFDAVKALVPGIFNDAGNIHALDNLLDAFGAKRGGAVRRTNAAGRALIQSFENCARRRPDGKFDAYPDPGSHDGNPWTIGWGSTGADIRKGTVWTQAQCDARFDQDLARFEDAVFRLVGSHATDNQFSALVSFAYNVGEGEDGLKTSTLLRKHMAGDYAGAQAQFERWNKQDGKVLDGLTRRRKREAALYGQVG